MRKRAPGAGRRPQGEFHGKSETLATRILPSTRAALDRAAKKNKRSLSQEVEYRLRLSIRSGDRKNRGIHIRALGEAVMLVAQFVEHATEKRWNEDAFTGEALRRGIEFLIRHFAARGNPITPPTVEKVVANWPWAESYRSAAGLGETESGRVIALIESWAFRSLEELVEGVRTMPGLHVPYEWYAHADLLRDLGSGWERARSFERERREEEKRS